MKLAEIRECAELGMTMEQTHTALGVPMNDIRRAAVNFGVKFAGEKRPARLSVSPAAISKYEASK